MAHPETARANALAIWQAGVDAVRPERCLPAWFTDAGQWPKHFPPLNYFERILVVGGGKAGAATSVALEAALVEQGVDLQRVSGWVDVPNESVTPLRAIHLHPSRPSGTNQPTAEAMAGTAEILHLAESAGPNDLLLCLISGGGSALMPAPVDGVSLADKQNVTKLLHQCGAAIQEMNAVRKHLSRIKGGGLVGLYTGNYVLSLIISDVIGDPLDVIASGPTCVDPSTFRDALAVLNKYQIADQIPPAVINHLRRGEAGQTPETLKHYPLDVNGGSLVENVILANNAMALESAKRKALDLGYVVVDLGSSIEGETRRVAEEMATLALSHRLRESGRVAILSGGETTVTLPQDHGLGGRNQEFVLAFLHHLTKREIRGITILSAGTDGEDGPTDAAGAIGDTETHSKAEGLGITTESYLNHHDAYHFFQQTDDLLRTRLTNTNVMDLRVILIDPHKE